MRWCERLWSERNGHLRVIVERKIHVGPVKVMALRWLASLQRGREYRLHYVQKHNICTCIISVCGVNMAYQRQETTHREYSNQRSGLTEIILHNYFSKRIFYALLPKLIQRANSVGKYGFATCGM